MLKSTLTKMKDRINQANRTWEQENDTKMLEKFKEIVDNGATSMWVDHLESNVLFLRTSLLKPFAK